MKKRALVTTLIAGCSLAFPGPAGASDPVFLGQNWSPADRQWFYTAPQGSQLIQYSWFKALERPDTQDLFVSDSLVRFGYLPNPVSPANPDGLPVGLVRDREGQAVWLGMTCAACHTGQINYNGATMQIDGAPANSDLYGFLAELSQSLSQTNQDNAKFDRFAGRVIGAGGNPEQKAALRRALDPFSTRFTTFVQDSTPDSPWGPARTDAFGMIFNRVSSIDLKIAANSRKPNAPVSYPHLWDTSWHDRVQWNAGAPNGSVVERLGRNVGEVLGVFARIRLEKPTGLLRYYPSSVKRFNLIALDEKVGHLRSPRWPPAILGPINEEKAAQGKEWYRTQCASCHRLVDRDAPNRKLEVWKSRVSEIGTDPAMATVPLTRDSATGSLQGVRQSIWYGERMREREPVFNLVSNVVIGAILSPIADAAADKILYEPPPDDRSALRSALYLGVIRNGPKTEAEATVDNKLRVGIKSFASQGLTTGEGYYKARPLNGIWATAPYLHNGSVPNLYQLLLPPEQRDATFSVGSREFDPKNVGFASSPGDGGFRFDTSLPGNRNTGHLYGTGLSDEQRWQLIEFLKTL
jgi:hypothetical protein